MSRRALRLPIVLAISMIVLLVLVIVGYVVLPVSSGALYWTLLVLGLIFLGMVLVGVVIYLTLSIKAINLNRRQSNFIDSVTHELKSPIASLKLYLQTLSKRPVSPEEQAEFYTFMLEDVERLDQLINHILSAARLEKTGAADAGERVDLTELLKSCVEEVCIHYRVPTSTVETNLAPCVVQGSHLDLVLIFRNLIDNAVKYANTDSPKVLVTAQYTSDRRSVIVKISDNGHGIPGSLHRKIFRRFVRLGTELERKKPGTGLGLYIVRTLVSRWKGRVQVSSPREGGTVFQVTLPNARAIETRDEKDVAGRQSAETISQVSPSL